MNRRDAVIALATASSGLPFLVLAADKPAAKPSVAPAECEKLAA